MVESALMMIKVLYPIILPLDVNDDIAFLEEV
jgi:hypothetical protein